MAIQKYLTIGDGGVWSLSASSDPKLGYILQGRGSGATLKVGPDHSNHTIDGVAEWQAGGVVLDYSTGNLKLTHGISLAHGHLAIENLSGGTVTLNGDSTITAFSSFVAGGPPSFPHGNASYVLNGSLTVSNGSTADFQGAKVSGHGTINIGAGSNLGSLNTVTMDNVLAGLHVNVANNSQLILKSLHFGAVGQPDFHGTITEAAGAKVLDYGAAHSAVREIFHKATGTLDLINRAGTQVAELQFAPGSREYTSINPNTQYAAITTDPHTVGNLPTIFTH